MRALLRSPPARAPQLASAAIASVSVPSDVAALLSRLLLSKYGPAVVSDLGVCSVDDAAFLTEAHLESIGMKPVERSKLLAAVASAAGPASQNKRARG
jgi:hypothetical protein